MKTRVLHGIAGSFIMISVLLAIYVNINWLWFTGFVGANLFQSSLTNWCLMSDILSKFGLSDGEGCSVDAKEEHSTKGKIEVLKKEGQEKA